MSEKANTLSAIDELEAALDAFEGCDSSDVRLLAQELRPLVAAVHAEHVELQTERDAKERQLRELQGERDTVLAELNALKAELELRTQERDHAEMGQP
jgi:chromosome segregation ATPase